MSTQIPPSENMEQRIEELLSQLTLKEKVALMSGRDNWRTVPIERLGIPSLTMTDGPHGVRTQADPGRLVGPTTAFPTGVSMAASWNPELIERVGAALGEEALAMGCDILLGPCVNIVRHPLAGRNFESYSEDPYLAGRIGVAFVKGVQSRGVGTSVKHFACNNQETERMRGSSVVDERTLREIYLAQFEMVVKEARPWTVMCSYNRLNGVYASQNAHLLREILKGEWGYDGVVISDWGANHTTVESVRGGLDIEMPGPAKYYGPLLVEAVYTWQVEEEVINNAVRRILRLILRSGKMDGAPRSAGSVNTAEHQSLARELAEEAITLLKNERGLLPLRGDSLRSVAVIGPNAAEAVISGGGSAYVDPPYRVSPLEALQARLPGRVRYEKGCENVRVLPTIKPEYLTPAQGEGLGLWGEFFDNTDFAGEPLICRVDRRLHFWFLSFAPLESTPRQFAVRWTGHLTVPESGTYTMGVRNTGICRVFLDGELVLENITPQTAGPWMMNEASAPLPLVAGQAHQLRVEYIRPAWLDWPYLNLLFGATPTPEEASLKLERAVQAAREAEVAIVFTGYPDGYETEGADRPDMALTGQQDELIQAVAQANPNTVVVLNVGAPVSMPWLDQVAAVVLAYYPGLENGNAVARVLLGEVNPSGKLPVTFPRRLQDTPAFVNFPGGREVRYGEGIFVGYRYYDIKDIEPLFPFGHGLSYTAFAYSDLSLPAVVKAGDRVTVALRVTNTGGMAGKEVVQLYVRDVVASQPRPLKELKGFAKVFLQPGESQVVSFVLDERALSFYDPDRGKWVAEPGEFEVLVGSSARDIRLIGRFHLE